MLLLPYGLVNLLEAVSWKYILIDLPEKTSLSRLFWLRLGGEALNGLTPTASLGGEPSRPPGCGPTASPWTRPPPRW